MDLVNLVDSERPYQLPKNGPSTSSGYHYIAPQDGGFRVQVVNERAGAVPIGSAPAVLLRVAQCSVDGEVSDDTLHLGILPDTVNVSFCHCCSCT